MSNAKFFQSEIKYYSATLHDDDNEKSFVSHNPQLYNLAHNTQATNRLTKITQFHERIDEFSEKPILTLGEQAMAEYLSNIIPFE